MKFYNLGLACLLTTLGITGCQTGENGVGGSLKAQGVYTTLAMSDFGLDLPPSGYVQKGSFGPGESPAAVILGYGTYNQQELVALELLESSTGRSLLSKDYRVTYGKAVIQPLAIRLSGDHKLKLNIWIEGRGKAWDRGQRQNKAENRNGEGRVRVRAGNDG